MPTKKSKPAAKKSQAGETLKKLFFAGLGLAEETNNKLHQRFNALAKKGQAHEGEIKKAVDDIRKTAQTRRKELEKKFTELVKQNELVKSKEFQSLLKRLETLEVKAAPKKSAAKKRSKPRKVAVA